MNIKYFLKNIYKRKKILIMLILQVAVYTFFIINLCSLALFKSNFIGERAENFPINNGAYVKQVNADKIEQNRENALKFIDYIKNNEDIVSYTMQFDDILPIGEFNIDTSGFETSYYESEDQFNKEMILLYRVDYNYYSKIKEYVKGSGFKEDDFKIEDEFIPVILGESYKNKYNIGDIITDGDIKYKVNGFLEKNILLMSVEPTLNVDKSSKCFITPLTDSFLDEPYNLGQCLRMMTFEFDEDADNLKMSNDILNKAKTLGINLELSNFKDEIDEFLSEFYSEILFELMRIGMLSVLSLGVFTLSFIYLINDRKREFGILYSIGANKKHIIRNILVEMLIIILAGYIISVPIYMNISKEIYAGFVNTFSILNIGLPFIVVILLAVISLIIPIINIIKMKPTELVRGK